MSEDPIFFFSHPPANILQPAKPFFSEGFSEEPDFLFHGDRNYNETDPFLANNNLLDSPHDDKLSYSFDGAFDGASRKDLDDSQIFVPFHNVKETPVDRNPSNQDFYDEEEAKEFIDDDEFIKAVLLQKNVSQISKCPQLSKEISLESTEFINPKPKFVRKPIKKSRSLKSKTKNEEKKNIHRYMIRQVIRSLASEDFQEKVKILCLIHGTDYEEIKQYYLGQIENFTSIQLLSEHWSVDPFDESNENRVRLVFREFSKWFLKERAIRYILNGKMKNPGKYIHYKNHIMLYYVDRPMEYKSNNKKKNVK
jgi:hypothetical protein